MFQKHIETMGREQMRALQLKRLQNVVKYAYERVPFYRNRFDSIGLKPDDIKTLDDIRKIPYTTKDDVAALREALAAGLSTLVRMRR